MFPERVAMMVSSSLTEEMVGQVMAFGNEIK